jgi:hypothetical protein
VILPHAEGPAQGRHGPGKRSSPAPESHYDWNVTEAELIDGLHENLRDAWQKLRAFGESLGTQRIYASAQSIMFSKKVCYFFVRPRSAKQRLKSPDLLRGTRVARNVNATAME